MLPLFALLQHGSSFLIPPMPTLRWLPSIEPCHFVRIPVASPAAMRLSLHNAVRKEERTTEKSMDIRQLHRRNILQLLISVGILEPSFCLASDNDSDLSSRFGAGKIRRFDPAGPFGAAEAPLPEWLNGEWEAEFIYRDSRFPLGKSFAEFKQLVGGNMRSPAEYAGSQTKVSLRWMKAGDRVVEDSAFNTQNLYNAFSKSITIEGSKGPRTRNVAWMPILTQRGIYEKVNSVQWKDGNNFDLVVKEIAPDLSVVGATRMQGTVVTRKWRASADGDAFTLSELFRIRRLSPGRAKLIETGTGDTEILTEFHRGADGAATGRQRALVYLVPFAGPEGALYADSEGVAVAVYDWELKMTRKSRPEATRQPGSTA